MPTTLIHLPLFPVSEGGAVTIMPDNFPIRVFVLRGSCPSNKGDCPGDNCPTGVMVLGG